MAGFCRNCGSPLADGQGFCTACGTPAAGSPVRPSTPAAVPASPPVTAAPPQTPPAPRPPTSAPAPAQSAAVPAAAGASKGGGTLTKVLAALAVVVFLFISIGVAGVWYVGHRIKQKAHEMGLDQISSENNTARGPVLGGIDACRLLSKEEVSAVVKMEVVRAEHTEGSDAGCEYSVMGDTPDMVAKHLSLMQKDVPEQQRQTMESLAKSFFHSSDAGQGGPSRHPGETPVFMFTVDNQAALAQMSITKATFGRMAPAMTILPGVGDDAFDVGNAVMMVRKGNTVVRILYMMCPCTSQDAVPLAKKIVGSM